MYNLVRWFIGKNQEDSIYYENEEGTSLPGHDSLNRGKRKKPEGKMIEEPLVIQCTAKELNHVLDKWIGDGVVRLFTVSMPPIEEERKNNLFCRIHNYVKHSTKDCWTLKRLFHKKLREGTLELTQ